MGVGPYFNRSSSESPIIILDDGCELQLDSTAFVSNGSQSNEKSNQISNLPLPTKTGSFIPNSNSLMKVGICPTFSNFSFTGWSLEQEERLMEDGKAQLEKVHKVHN